MENPPQWSLSERWQSFTHHHNYLLFKK